LFRYIILVVFEERRWEVDDFYRIFWIIGLKDCLGWVGWLVGWIFFMGWK
jgi:hypothetical protein